MRRSLRWAAALYLLCAAATPISAQESGGESQQASNNWVPSCVSPGRAAPADCVLEQKLITTETGAFLGAVRILMPNEPRTPTMALQLPHGLFLPAGVTLQIDGGESLQLTLQTCDGNGCYATTPVDEALLNSLKRGAQLRLGIENVKRETLSILVPLDGFTAGYGMIE